MSVAVCEGNAVIVESVREKDVRPADVLLRWRGVERAMAEVEPGTLRARELASEYAIFRDAYQRAFRAAVERYEARAALNSWGVDPRAPWVATSGLRGRF